jgi:hypothetical protein
MRDITTIGKYGGYIYESIIVIDKWLYNWDTTVIELDNSNIWRDIKLSMINSIHPRNLP